jgi:dTDP-4-amino-4,6-dideoxygalactose transaminase
VGASGDLCCFSFDPIKNLTTGDGGMIVGLDESQTKRARTLRYMGLSKDAFTRLNTSTYSWEYEVPEVGYRYHMNDIAAAMGLVHLKLVDEDNARREAIVQKYRQLLAGVPGLTLLEYESDRRSSNHLFPVLVEQREALTDKLTMSRVTVGGHYARNDVYQIFQRADVPNAEHFCSRVLTLPMHAELTDEEIEFVTGLIREGW